MSSKNPFLASQRAISPIWVSSKPRRACCSPFPFCCLSKGGAWSGRCDGLPVLSSSTTKAGGGSEILSSTSRAADCQASSPLSCPSRAGGEAMMRFGELAGLGFA